MKTLVHATYPARPRAHRSPSAAAALAFVCALAAPAARAQDTEVLDLIRPESRIRLGVATVSDDAPRLGAYTGLADKRGYLLADFSVVQRDATGFWLTASGRNLGLRTRELRLGAEQQGQWSAGFEYSKLVRLEPQHFLSSLGGVGTEANTVNINPATAQREVALGTQRERTTLSLTRALARGLDLNVRYTFEDKTGERLFGRGTGQFLVEPIDSRHQQLELTLGYVGSDLQLQGAYLGSFFVSQPNVLSVSVVNGATSAAQVALAPDNEQHQLSLSGGYTPAPGTRASFRFAHTVGRQNEKFFTPADFVVADPTLQPGPGLNARLETTLAYASLGSRVLRDLNLSAQWRHEERRDRTPRAQFLPATTGRDGFNTPFSRRSEQARMEANWSWQPALRLIGGFDYEDIERSTLGVRQASWRVDNHESTWRVELRSNVGEALSGSLALLRAHRGGGAYLPADNNAAADVIDPLHFADRNRNKVRLSVDWAPLEPLSLQLLLENGRDTYNGRVLGPERGRNQVATLEATWTVSDAWQVSAWGTRDANRATQRTISGANGTTVLAQTWSADLRAEGRALGAGLRGRPNERLELGADGVYARDRNRYGVLAVVPAAAQLPDITTTRKTLRLFAGYSLRSDLTVRLEAGLERWHSDDWTWTGWAYADGTTAVAQPFQKSDFVGTSLIYRWR